MRKKLLTIMALVVTLCLCLGGCGKKTEPVTDTIKWMNTTYAVLTARNEGDFNAIGGFEKNGLSKKIVLPLLEDSWEVTDRQSADEMLDWLLKEGHRTPYLEEIDQMKESGIFEASKEDIQKAYAKDSNYVINMVDAYKKYGEKAIDAWDYCRAIQLLGSFYVADFYTKEETLDKSLEIAKVIQQSYTSWDDLMESYMYGFQYWQEEDASDKESETFKRREIYEKLKNSKDNPYKIEWNLKLTKTW
jgi:hypothetical protein